MTKASIDLQDLRRRIYVKAKAETSWKFWGLYVHVCKLETLREAYALAKRNDGAPGSDGVTFEGRCHANQIWPARRLEVPTQVQAAVAARHVWKASSRKTRSVRRDVRWRWTLKVFWTTA